MTAHPVLNLMVMLLLARPASAHFMWVRASRENAVVTFSECPTKAGLAAFINGVAARTRLAVATAPARVATNVTLAEKRVSILDGELRGSLPKSAAASPTSIEGSALWGLFTEMGPKTLLQYWFSAPRVAEPNDWFFVDGMSTNRLSLTLRPVCDQGAAASQDDGDNATAKVVAVTRFDGVNVANHVVNLFDAAGEPAGNATTADKGVVVLRLPRGKPVYAWSKHIEAASGTDPVSGKPYDRVAHYSSTSMQVC